jgi:hypothetical protein
MGGFDPLLPAGEGGLRTPPPVPDAAQVGRLPKAIGNAA